MTWFEFRSKVDEYLDEHSVDPQEIEILYLNLVLPDENDGELEVEINKDGFLCCYPTYTSAK